MTRKIINVLNEFILSSVRHILLQKGCSILRAYFLVAIDDWCCISDIEPLEGLLYPSRTCIVVLGSYIGSLTFNNDVVSIGLVCDC